MKYKLGIDTISKKSAKIKHQTNFVRPLYTQNAFDSQRTKNKYKSKEFNKKAVLRGLLLVRNNQFINKQRIDITNTRNLSEVEH